MSAEEYARHIVRAMKRRSRLWIGLARSRVGRWVRLFAPGVIDAVARRAIREGR